MSADWEVGDLAMLVVAGYQDCPCDDDSAHEGTSCPPLGSVRTVTAIEPSVLRDGYRCGCTDLVFADGLGAVSFRCVKVTPPKADAFDLETINLMNPKPVEAVR